jgi:hypothetical protein
LIKEVPVRRRLILSALFFSHATIAGPAVWTTTGPNGGGLTYLATSSASPGTVYVASGFAVYRSTDSGASFTRRAGAQELGFIVDLVVSPANADVVYLLTDSGVMKSTDGAGSFAPAVSGLPTADFFARDLAMQPGTPATLILTSASHGAFRSTDGGASWAAIASATLPTHLSQVAFNPTNPAQVLVSPCPPDDGSTYSGAPLYRSTDGGTSFSAATVTGAPPELASCTAALAYSSTTPGVVLATEGNGPLQPFNTLLRSTDGGLTFTRSAPGPVQTLSMASFSFVAGAPAEVLAANARGSLHRSTDEGLTFIPAPTPTLPGPSAALESQIVTSKPGDPSVRYFISRGAGLFRSTDSGATWTESNLGIATANIRAIAINPANPARVYAGQAESDAPVVTWPFFRSSDGGSSWGATGSSFALDWIRGLLVDSNTAATPASTVLYAVGRDIAPTSQPITLRASGVAKSIDGGATWSNLNSFAGLGSAPNPPVAQLGTVRTIVPDRSVVSASAWSRLYLTASGNGTCSAVGAAVNLTVPRLWRTLDAGASWNTISTAGGVSVGSDGLPSGECVNAGTVAQPFAFADFPIPVPLVVDHADPNTLYVGTYLRGYNSQSTYVPNAPNGIFKSTNGGVSWTLSSTGLPLQPGSTTAHYSVLAMVMDPTNRNVLYAAVNPFFDNSSFIGNVYKSTNGGASWAVAGSGLAGQDIRALVIDPDNSLRVFAASGGSVLNPGGVFVSEDGGTTWNSISAGLPVTSATALAIDNSVPAAPVIYAGSRTGVYSFTRVSDGDGDGAPTAPENAAPNGGDGNADGQPDSGQSSVASLPGTSAAAQRASLPFTISLTPLSGNCSRLYDVIAVPSDTFAADPQVQKPDGAFRFEVASCTSVRVSLRIHGGSFNGRSFVRAFGARVQGDPLSIGWNTLAATVAGDTISFVLSDNQPGDARQDSGRILFQGGPAFELALFGNGFE